MHLRGLHPPSDDFVEDDDAATCGDALLRDHRAVTVVGAPGVGKTRLVFEWIARTAERWSGGVYGVRLNEDDDALDLIEALLGIAGETLDPLERLRTTLAARAKGGPVLLWLDQTPEDSIMSEVIDAALDAGDSVHVVCSGLSPIGHPLEHVVHVRPLRTGGDAPSPAARLALARARAAAMRGQGPHAADEIAREAEGVPLVIECAVREAAGGEDPDAPLIASLESAWRRVDPELAEALAALSTAATSIGAAETARRLAGCRIAHRPAAAVLESLLRRSLVEQDAEGSVRILGHVRHHARRARIDHAATRAQMALRDAEEHLDAGREDRAIRAVDEALAHATTSGSERLAARAHVMKCRVLHDGGAHREARDHARRAHETFTRLGDESDIDGLAAVLALHALEEGRLAEARSLASAALPRARRRGDVDLEATLLAELGAAVALLGAESAAEELFVRALQLDVGPRAFWLMQVLWAAIPTERARSSAGAERMEAALVAERRLRFAREGGERAAWYDASSAVRCATAAIDRHLGPLLSESSGVVTARRAKRLGVPRG